MDFCDLTERLWRPSSVSRDTFPQRGEPFAMVVEIHHGEGRQMDLTRKAMGGERSPFRKHADAQFLPTKRDYFPARACEQTQ